MLKERFDKAWGEIANVPLQHQSHKNLKIRMYCERKKQTELLRARLYVPGWGFQKWILPDNECMKLGAIVYKGGVPVSHAILFGYRYDSWSAPQYYADTIGIIGGFTRKTQRNKGYGLSCLKAIEKHLMQIENPLSYNIVASNRLIDRARKNLPFRFIHQYDPWL